MIIKSIYINHFGCLKDVGMKFDENINVISLPNESGKSTVAEFIRVMLYGVNSLRFNQRKKYMPFSHTSMGGEMTISHNGTDYIIKRTFGLRKSNDKIEVINALNGAKIKEYSVDNVCETMCGINGDTYENTCYIKQLSSKIESDKSSEIQSKLINLIQNSDENYSYQKAVGIIDNAIKDLEGNRGKIARVQSVLNELAIKFSEKNKVNLEYEKAKEKLNELQKQGTKNNMAKYLLLSWIPFLICTGLIVFSGVKLFFIALLVIFGAVGIFAVIKNKKNNDESISHAKQIGFYESKIESLKKQYSSIDVSPTDEYKQKLQFYNKALVDLRTAKDALAMSFEQLQTDYAPKLNNNACDIFRKITSEKYVEFMVDDCYNITVRDNKNNIVSSEYLSSGTFDQIYFSLRMALIGMICEGMPVVLDDAFALYDDERLKKAMEYLKTLENQVIVFSCQLREKDFVEMI